MKNKKLFNEKLAVSLICILLMGCSVPVAESSTFMSTSTPVAPTTVPLTFTSIAPDASTGATATNALTQILTMDDYQYVMECSGEGNPIVLLIGGRAATWEPVQEALIPSTHTCVFEHAGSRPTPLTAAEIAKNVHTLLDDAKMSGLYVLVGFSV